MVQDFFHPQEVINFSDQVLVVGDSDETQSMNITSESMFK